ncbi:MAG: hypothetical protein JW993_10280 [Sedimentisphaerales bacterium]|nr:hypothetical protein [Sedimentisphaerales bacterium]
MLELLNLLLESDKQDQLKVLAAAVSRNAAQIEAMDRAVRTLYTASLVSLGGVLLLLVTVLYLDHCTGRRLKALEERVKSREREIIPVS